MGMLWVTPAHHANLDDAMLLKPGSLATPGSKNLRMAVPCQAHSRYISGSSALPRVSCQQQLRQEMKLDHHTDIASWYNAAIQLKIPEASITSIKCFAEAVSSAEA